MGIILNMSDILKKEQFISSKMEFRHTKRTNQRHFSKKSSTHETVTGRWAYARGIQRTGKTCAALV